MNYHNGRKIFKIKLGNDLDNYLNDSSFLLLEYELESFLSKNFNSELRRIDTELNRLIVDELL